MMDTGPHNNKNMINKIHEVLIQRVICLCNKYLLNKSISILRTLLLIFVI